MNNENILTTVLIIGFVGVLAFTSNYFLGNGNIKEDNSITNNSQQTRIQSNTEDTKSEENVDLKAPKTEIKGNIEYSASILAKLKTQKEVLIPVNQPTAYSGRTQESILNERKKYVSQVFNLPNYNPSENIFGSIVDGKPWISLQGAYCNGLETKKGRTSGPSEESVFMNNPLALVMVEMPYYGYVQPNSCSPITKFLPTKITVTKNSINIYYNISEFQNVVVNEQGKKYAIYYLKPINAKDFGYEWGYVAKRKNLGFSHNNAINQSPYNFKDFIHCGGACDIEGGCNNGSPNQPQLGFGLDNKYPAYMQIYLWKEKPDHWYSDADMIVNLYFN